MKKTTHSLRIDSPVGPLQLEATDTSLTAIRFVESIENDSPEAESDSPLAKAHSQLKEYFNGTRTSFNLPLQPGGTPFEQEVWNTLQYIPFGHKLTYLQLAKKLGDPNKVRAVGRANGQNPLPIVIPCHRVIGSNDKLTGYAGGIERKRWLLQHEGILLL